MDGRANGQMDEGDYITSHDNVVGNMWQVENYIKSIKEVVAILLVLHKQLQILEDSLLHLDAVVVADRVFAEEVKLDDELFAIIFLVQSDVLHAE